MEAVVRITCFALLLVNFASSGVLPVEKCNLEDSTCMTESIQKAIPTFVAGIPELETPVLDPLHMDDVNINLSGLQFHLSGGQLKGLKNVVIDNGSFDTSKKEVKLEFHLDGVLTGAYKAGGKIVLLPIEGNGDMTLELKNLHIKAIVPYGLVTRDGKTYAKLKKINYEYEVVDGAIFSLTNLFNGNKELSDNIISVLNKEWKLISREFGKPLIDACAKKIFNAIAKFLDQQAVEDIANN